jgi:prenylcysteine oxidase/farnesylcysteine lyase
MAIDGAMQIDGGNWQIFDRMVTVSNATAVLNTTVTDISRSKGQYNIKTSTTNHLGQLSTDEEPFDTVVLAAPLQYSDISLEKGLLRITPDEIPYVTLHVTLFTSPKNLNPLFFNITPGSDMPNTILTTLPPGEEVPPKQDQGVGPAGFFSISTLRQLVNPETLEKEYLYKIFSPEEITSEFLSGILGAEGLSPQVVVFSTIKLIPSSSYRFKHPFSHTPCYIMVLPPRLAFLSS